MIQHYRMNLLGKSLEFVDEIPTKTILPDFPDVMITQVGFARGGEARDTNLTNYKNNSAKRFDANQDDIITKYYFLKIN